MDFIIFVFVGILCVSLGARVFWAEERNKVFNKRIITVTDVRKYNQICGGLIIGFGIVAEVTLYFVISTDGWLSTVLTLLIILEAYIVMRLYNKVERKMLKRS